jgi:hypothetical protein
LEWIAILQGKVFHVIIANFSGDDTVVDFVVEHDQETDQMMQHSLASLLFQKFKVSNNTLFAKASTFVQAQSHQINAIYIP